MSLSLRLPQFSCIHIADESIDDLFVNRLGKPFQKELSERTVRLLSVSLTQAILYSQGRYILKLVYSAVNVCFL